MPKTSKQLTQPELQPQPPQMPSGRMETQKPKSHNRLWLLTGVMVLLLIVGVMVLLLIVFAAAAWQVSNSSQSTKRTTSATQLPVDQPLATHDMDHSLKVDQPLATHDMDHSLTVDLAPVTHDMDHTLTVDLSPVTHDMDHTLTVDH